MRDALRRHDRDRARRPPTGPDRRARAVAPARRPARPAPAGRRRGGAADAFALLRETARRDRSRAPPPGRRARWPAARSRPICSPSSPRTAPSIAAPLIAPARLDADAWLALLPRLGPAARALLRHREDLDAEVRHALERVRPQRLRAREAREVAAAATAGAGGEQSESQIRELVARIEAFRRAARAHPPAAPLVPSAARPRAFAGKPAPTASSCWVEGAPRGPLVGQSIAAIAGRGHYGVDGQAAGAFEKRAPFRDARFSVAGDGPAAGDWRISGVPFFDAAARQLPRLSRHRAAAAARRGRAQSHRRPTGRVRHPISGRFAAPADPRAAHAAERDHRLRRDDRGPVYGPGRRRLSRPAPPRSWRRRAGCSARSTISTPRRGSRRAGFEPTTARSTPSPCSCRLHESYEQVARAARRAASRSRSPRACRRRRSSRARPSGCSRACSPGRSASPRRRRDDRAALTLAPRGDARDASPRDRPAAAIAGVDEAALLDPGYSPEGDWPGAPALGLGFALRLVRNLAEAVGGALVVETARFALYLPGRRRPSARARRRRLGPGLLLPRSTRHAIPREGL